MRISIGLFLALLALPAHAGALAQALAAAWERSPQAASVSGLAEEARAQGELAAALTPGSAAVSLAHRNDTLGSGRGRREWEVELAAPLWLPGQQAARQAEARAAQARVAADAQAGRLELAGELRTAWWNLALARAQRDLAWQRASTARALEQDVARRTQAGDLARVDANLARNERLAAETEHLTAEAETARAEQLWQGLTGLPAPHELEPEVLPTSPRQAHPGIDALEAGARLAHARLRLAETTRREAPELALNLQRERGTASETYGHNLGLKLTWPLGSEARNRRDHAAARAEAWRSDAEAARQAQRLAQEEASARQMLDSAEQRIELSRERGRLMAENLGLAEKAFALGETDLATLLRVRAGEQDARAALVRQTIERNAAVSRLLQSLGVLP